MKVKLDDKRTLISDPYCCWIEETRTVKKTGKTYQVRVSGYCPTIELALKSYIDKKLLASDPESLAGLYQVILDLKDEVEVMGSDINAKVLEAIS